MGGLTTWRRAMPKLGPEAAAELEGPVISLGLPLQ
jgi:hypothetical protein